MSPLWSDMALARAAWAKAEEAALVDEGKVKQAEGGEPPGAARASSSHRQLRASEETFALNREA